MEWNESGVEGQSRFLGRVYRFITRNIGRDSGPPNDADRQALRKLHQTVRKVTSDFDSRWHFNTSIASLMELTNELYQLEANLSSSHPEICRTVTLLLAPFAPYTAQELWSDLGNTGPAFRQPWPNFDPELAKEDLAEIPVQVNGKLRGHLHVPFGTQKDELESLALANDKVQSFVQGKQIIKIVVVPDRLVNIVVR